MHLKKYGKGGREFSENDRRDTKQKRTGRVVGGVLGPPALVTGALHKFVFRFFKRAALGGRDRVS